MSRTGGSASRSRSTRSASRRSPVRRSSRATGWACGASPSHTWRCIGRLPSRTPSTSFARAASRFPLRSPRARRCRRRGLRGRAAVRRRVAGRRRSGVPCGNDRRDRLDRRRPVRARGLVPRRVPSPAAALTAILATMRRIPLSIPVMRGNEAKYLQECIDTNWVSYVGPFVERFETEFASAVGAPHAVAMNNGTAALHIALLAAGVGAGDLVILPDLTFIAPANAVRYCGADPVFVDVTADRWQLDVEKVAAFLTRECERTASGVRDRATGKRIAALLPVHLLGHPVDLDPLMAVAADYGLPVVEDATESLGSTYKGRAPGTFGLAGCFSFNGHKIITSGGGGMHTTASHDIP